MSTAQTQELWRKTYEIGAPGEPKINIRAKTQIVVEGRTRYMGEVFQLPQREGLGFVGNGESEMVVDLQRPLTWMHNAPGPEESFNIPGDFANQGSREGAIGSTRGGQPGDQQQRQLKAWHDTVSLQPQSYDDFRNPSDAGMRDATGQWWRQGAVGPTSGYPPQPGTPPPMFPPGRPPMFPPGRPPGFTPPRPPRREERRDDRDDRREARHDRRDERYDERHEERHERRDERYDRRHEARDDRDDRREARHDRRDERGDREAHHERRDERGDRDRRSDREGRRHQR